MVKNRISIESMFLILSIFIGIILVFIVPPFQSPDEDSHFLKAYLISNRDFFPEQHGKDIGYDIPINLDTYIQDKKNFMSDYEKKYTYNDQYYEQLLSFSYDVKKFRDISTSQSSIVAHIIPAIGVKIASLIGSFNDNGPVGPAVLLQFARIACLLVYSIIGYFAIRITPKFKKSFFTILMLPSSLFLRSMVTYDSLILVITALSLAKMLQIYCAKNYEFKKKDMFLFIICGYILLNIKTVYSFVFLLMFAIPNQKYGGMKNKIKYYSIMIASVLLLTLILKIPYLRLDIPTNSLITKQVEFVIHNPFKYLKIVFSNIIGQAKIQSYWMVGTYGLLDTYVPVLLIYMIYINLIFILLYDILSEKLKLSIWIGVTYFILTIISIIAVYTSMYTGWTPIVTNEVGGNAITGVQGRYFLPYLLIIPFIFSNKLIVSLSNRLKKVLKKCDNYFNNFYYLESVLNIVIMIFMLIARYWI